MKRIFANWNLKFANFCSITIVLEGISSNQMLKRALFGMVGMDRKIPISFWIRILSESQKHSG